MKIQSKLHQPTSINMRNFRFYNQNIKIYVLLSEFYIFLINRKCSENNFYKFVSPQQKNIIFSMISQQQESALLLKELIQNLQQSTIQGSAITMCLLPNKNISDYSNLLASEIAQASNIKDKGNRQSVIEGLKSVKQALKQYKKVPTNGIILIAANVLMPNKRAYEKILHVIEPPRPITQEVYSCGKNFSFSHINEQILVNSQAFGFIVVDGNSCLLAIIKGGHKQVLKQLKSDIMRNHNKGGQSSVRFSRLRDQSRYNFIKASCEQANRQFLNLNQNIQGYILAGSANLKNDFIQNETLNPAIKNNILQTVDVAQGSVEGLKQAILQSKDIMMNTSLLKQRKLMEQFFQSINRTIQKITNGFNSVVQVINLGIAEKVICSSSLSKEQKIYLKQICAENGCQLLFLSDKTEKSSIFIKNFGGIAAFLRYEFDSTYLKEQIMDEEQTGFGQKQEFFL